MAGRPALREFATLVQELKWKNIEVIEKKQHISFDHESTRESTFSMLGCLPMIMAPGFFFAAFQIYKVPDIGPIAAAALGGIGLILLAVGYYFLYVAKAHKDRYILDLECDDLIEVKKKGQDVQRRTLCAIRDFDFLVLHSVYSFKSGSPGWRFGLTAVTKAGSLVEFTERDDCSDRERVLKLGSTLGKLLDVPFEYGEENTIFEYHESPKGIDYEFVHFEPKKL
jgi:hypothetical protein